MMQRTLSVQVSLDFSSGDEAAEMLRVAFLVSPIATALFAASPFDGPEESKFLSVRAQAWRFTDPKRAGEVTASANPGATLKDYAEYALDSPMMFRIKGDDYLPMHGASFREVLSAGQWADGEPVSVADVWNHLGSIFTDGRLKKGLIELRSTDGQLPGDLDSVAAFWVGLLYDKQARAAALELLGGLDAEEREKALDQAPRFAFSASWGERPMIDVARDLVTIVQGGLERRVAEGLEAEGTLQLLAPVERRLRQGRTAAEELLELWRGRWKRDRAHLIEALRFRAP
jgi:glutamate--cysteine ligase